MLNRLLAPFRSTTGLARWILVTGIVITIAFVVMTASKSCLPIAAGRSSRCQ